MGTGASLPASLPETLDKATAQSLAGDAFNEAAFDAAAKDDQISRDAFLKAAEEAKAKPTSSKASEPSAAPHDADDALAKATFNKLRLKGKLLQAMNEKRRSLNDEAADIAPSEPVIDSAQLKQAFIDMGDEVESKSLFTLVQQADPEAEGVITLPLFLE
jgi:hypothetical protein